jgi:hypothetical protein
VILGLALFAVAKTLDPSEDFGLKGCLSSILVILFLSALLALLGGTGDSDYCTGGRFGDC